MYTAFAFFLPRSFYFLLSYCFALHEDQCFSSHSLLYHVIYLHGKWAFQEVNISDDEKQKAQFLRVSGYGFALLATIVEKFLPFMFPA